jgi:uncharacterized protein YbjT (DUF2867 family)
MPASRSDSSSAISVAHLSCPEPALPPPPYDDTDAVTRALAGIATVLMVSATESPQRLAEHRSFVAGAVAAGVQHLVYISFVGAAADATFTHARVHWHTEQTIRDTGLDFTFLRDNLYLDFLPGLVSEAGVIAGPAGDGRVAAVAQDDIAGAASAILQRALGPRRCDVQPHRARGAHSRRGCSHHLRVQQPAGDLLQPDHR